jgi:CMP-N-acetylneuraminic acid synthetase
MTYGSEVLDRPEDLSQDDSSTISVIINVLHKLEQEEYIPNVVILLQPTSPLRITYDIDTAVELFLTTGCQSVVSVCEMEHNPCWSFELKRGYLNPLFSEKYLNMRRQDLPRIYQPNGALFISKPETLYRTKSFYSTKTLPYIMPQERSIDIDSQMSLLQAELFLKKAQASIALS